MRVFVDRHGGAGEPRPSQPYAAQSEPGAAGSGTNPEEPAAAQGLDLVRRGVVSTAAMLRVLALRGGGHEPLPRMLRSHGLSEDRGLARALAARRGTLCLGPGAGLPDPRLIAALGPAVCIALGCLPWRRAGAVTLVAVTDPDGFEARRAEVERVLGPVALAVVAETDLHAALAGARRPALRRGAESSVRPEESCRGWNADRAARTVALVLALVALALVLAPGITILALLGLLMVSLILSTGLRLAATLAALTRPDPQRTADPPPEALPVISILVPLLREPEIAARLVRRLGALDYPRDRLEVVLVVEEDDAVTRAALARADLPGWMRALPVPAAPLRTKPRALNYALTFTRGALIGVYDAEDAPDRGQLRAVARAFASGGTDLACVQGVLDYYNPDTNWMTRCFTIEYAAWFRLVLTGFARMGLVVPLGGTTLFFRRDLLEALGGWDAHNVTEDADLGVRLARHGYRTELMDSATHEEANGRILPWIRQRSRWLKGYAMTYIVHMRAPRLLWRQLGAWRFFGFQVLFLGTLIQFLLAPIYWSLWLLVLGLDLEIARAVPPGTGWGVLVLLLGCELVAIAINLAALRGTRHRGLGPWVLTLGFYFPLATLAAYKAAWEMLRHPFYWDKTRHGLDDGGHRPVEHLR